MNLDQAINEARMRIHSSIEAAADRAILEGKFIAKMHREAIKRKAEHHNRSAGQRRRYSRLLTGGKE